jgi:hypothetical protein
MTKEKITSVFVTDTTLEIKNVLQPMNRTQSLSKVFATNYDAFLYQSDMHKSVNLWNEKKDYTTVTSADDDFTLALKKNNKDILESDLICSKTVETPVVTIREVKITDLTVEQKLEFEKLNNCRIVEETFPKKVVVFKTASKFFAVTNDNSNEAVNVQ